MGVLPARQGPQVLLSAAAADQQQALLCEPQALTRILTARASKKPANPHLHPRKCRPARCPISVHGKQQPSVVCHSKSALYVVSEPLTGERHMTIDQRDVMPNRVLFMDAQPTLRMQMFQWIGCHPASNVKSLRMIIAGNAPILI